MRDGIKTDEPEKKSRGRPRAYEPETALRQAAEAFWKTGYSGTSLDDISAATGMNRPSLRAAFGDKRELYLKALGDYWERQFVVMDEALRDEASLADSLMRIYEASLSIYFSNEDQALGCFVVGTAITEAPGDAEIREIVATGLRELDAGFETRIKRARSAGELDADADPKALALLASATLHSLAVRARAGSPRSELKKLARKAVAIICR